MKNKKVNIAKIIFWVSFIPYVLIILVSLYFAIYGHEIRAFVTGEYIRTDYGMEAFLDVGLSLIGVYSLVFPVLPIVFLYQVVFIICSIVKKRKNAQ